MEEYVKAIVGAMLPTVKDMELIKEYGLLNWLIAFIVKVGLVAFILWLFFSRYELQSPFKKRVKSNLFSDKL